MTQKLAVINGLRGIAILAVLFRHVFIEYAKHDVGVLHLHGVLPSPILAFPLAPIVNSHQAVTLFFILSAFVLTVPYESNRRTMHGMRDAWAFYVRRAWRLLPLLCVVLVGSVLAKYTPESPHAFAQQLWVNVKAALFMTTDLTHPPANGSLWSLRIEIWFCLLLPLLLFVQRRVGAATLLIASVLLTLATNLAALIWLQEHHQRLITYNIMGNLSHFVLGMAVAKAFVERGNRRHSGVMLFCALGVAYTGVTISQFAVLEQGLILNIIGRQITSIGLALTLYAFVTTPSTLLHRILESWPLQMLGLMCYSLYAWHVIFLWQFNARESGLNAFYFLVFTLGFSFLSYRFLEFGHVRDIRKLLPITRKREQSSLFLHPETVPA